MSNWQPPHQQHPPQYNPIPPQQRQPDYNMQTPAAVTYYRIYAGVLAVLYLAVVGIGAALLMFNGEFSGHERGEMIVNAVVFIAVGLPLLFASGASIFFPQRKWTWIAHVIIAAMGTSSCCFAPFSILIILKYLEPDVKRYYGV